MAVVPIPVAGRGVVSAGCDRNRMALATESAVEQVVRKIGKPVGKSGVRTFRCTVVVEESREAVAYCRGSHFRGTCTLRIPQFDWVQTFHQPIRHLLRRFDGEFRLG